MTKLSNILKACDIFFHLKSKSFFYVKIRINEKNELNCIEME